MKKTIIAIDPGASGALAYLRSESGAPIIYLAHNSDPLDSLKDASLDGLCEVWIEDVPSFAGENRPGSSMFRLGKNCGMWEGIARGLGLPVRLVRPQEWQAGLSGVAKLKGPDRKRALRTCASRVFPGVKCTLDNCDALLILDYAIRKTSTK